MDTDRNVKLGEMHLIPEGCKTERNNQLHVKSKKKKKKKSFPSLTLLSFLGIN